MHLAIATCGKPGTTATAAQPSDSYSGLVQAADKSASGLPADAESEKVLESSPLNRSDGGVVCR